MNKNSLLTVGIIILSIGMIVYPVVGSLTMQKQMIKDMPLSFNYTKESSGISLITIKVDGEMGLNDWYINDVSFYFTNESDDIAEIFYRINGGAYQTYTKPFYITQDGEDIMLEWRAIDYGGNYSGIDGPFFCSIDQTDPDIDLTYKIISGNPWQGWIFEFTAEATDAMSGMERVEFYLNDLLQHTVHGPGPTYVWTLRFFPIPHAKFWATAFDKAGNSAWDAISEPCDIGVLDSFKLYGNIIEDRTTNDNLDNVSSSEIVEKENNKIIEKSFSSSLERDVFDPGYVIVVFKRKTGDNLWLINVSIPIFYETDRIDKVYYQFNDGGWILYTDPVIPSDGINLFSWYVVDSEGYTSTPDSISSFKVDMTLPEINLFSTNMIRKFLEKNKIKFVASVYDITSGIDRVEFYENYTGIKPRFVDYNIPFEWIWTGSSNKEIIAIVYDNAGNSNNSSMNISGSHCSIKQNTQQFSDLVILRLLERFLMLKRLLELIRLI